MSKLENPRVPTSAADAKHPFDAAELLKHPPGSVYPVHGETSRVKDMAYEELGSSFAVERTKENGKNVCYISTNDHVTRPVVSHPVFVDLPDGKQVAATKVFADPKRDIALLRVKSMTDPETNCRTWKLADADQWAPKGSKLVRISSNPEADAAVGKVLNYVTLRHGDFVRHKPRASHNPDDTQLFAGIKGQLGNSGSALGDGTNLAYGMVRVVGVITTEAHHKVSKSPMVLGVPAQFIAEDLQYMHRGLTKLPKQHK